MNNRELGLRDEGFQLSYCEIRHGKDSIEGQSNPYCKHPSVSIQLGE